MSPEFVSPEFRNFGIWSNPIGGEGKPLYYDNPEDLIDKLMERYSYTGIPTSVLEIKAHGSVSGSGTTISYNPQQQFLNRETAIKLGSDLSYLVDMGALDPKALVILSGCNSGYEKGSASAPQILANSSGLRVAGSRQFIASGSFTQGMINQSEKFNTGDTAGLTDLKNKTLYECMEIILKMSIKKGDKIVSNRLKNYQQKYFNSKEAGWFLFNPNRK